MRIKALFLSALLSACTVFAQDANQVREAAERLLDLFNMNENFDQTMKQAVQMPLSMIDSQDLSPEQKAEAKRAVEASMKVTMERFSWERMKDMFIDIYAEVFTVEEINGLIEFYESPLGRQFIEKQPQLMQATMAKMQALMQEMMPQIQKEVEQALEEAKSADEPAPPAPAP